MKGKSKLYSISTLVIATLIVLASCAPKPTFNGSIIDPPVAAKSFSLTDQNNEILSLSDLQGDYVLLFFGFSSCLDECPATMAALAQVRSSLGDQADKTKIVMIATDPANDTPEAMGEFVSRFDPTSIGLTGTKEELQPVWADYGVMVLDSGETHSTRVYLIDPQGMWRLTYSSADNPDAIAADMELLFKEQ
ncbi:MAG: SCO family protein [Anaerolineales bacterium]